MLGVQPFSAIMPRGTSVWPSPALPANALQTLRIWSKTDVFSPIVNIHVALFGGICYYYHNVSFSAADAAEELEADGDG